MVESVSDLGSNAEENIVHAARSIGRSKDRRAVFEAIYYGKKAIKTVPEIASKTGLTEKRVAERGKELVSSQIIDQVRQNGRVAYRKRDFFHHNKQRILRLVDHPDRISKVPTKRTPQVSGDAVVQVSVPRSVASARKVTIDDIDSFAEARAVEPSGNLPKTVSEEKFKRGVQAILGEEGDFKDWGGELRDLSSGRLWMGEQRLAAAFAFKGPGTTGKLTPGKMGKNGDQVQRLFMVSADVFFVQYWAEVDDAIVREMETQAIARSAYTQSTVYYCVVDGVDSNRLYRAYSAFFDTSD